jgi:hypothetical protein
VQGTEREVSANASGPYHAFSEVASSESDSTDDYEDRRDGDEEAMGQIDDGPESEPELEPPRQLDDHDVEVGEGRKTATMTPHSLEMMKPTTTATAPT